MALQTDGHRAVNKAETSNTIQVAHIESTNIVNEAVKPLADANYADAGFDAYVQALELDPEHLEQLAKGVRRKLDFILLPLVVDYPPVLEFVSNAT